MEFCFSFLGGDARQRYAAESLRREGHRVYTRFVPGLDDCGKLADGNIVILPTPVLDAEGRIRGTALTPKEAVELFSGDAAVFGGTTAGLQQIFPTITDTSQWEELAIANAVLTAEGAIGLAVDAIPGTVQGGRFLVIGAGRIGLCLARKLKALGGHVTVTARKSRDLAVIEALGLRADLTGVYQFGLDSYDCVCNTVPAAVFTDAQLGEFPIGCPMIELASAPGGFSREACEKSGLVYISGSALPGRTAPKAAGENLARALLRHLRSQG